MLALFFTPKTEVSEGHVFEYSGRIATGLKEKKLNRFQLEEEGGYINQKCINADLNQKSEFLHDKQ